MSVVSNPALQGLLDRLHRANVGEEAELGTFFMNHAKTGRLDWKRLDPESHAYLAQKMVALEPEKAEFCHLMCRALQAHRVVEVGTSHGVSTLYLADAVRANGGGTVIATEYEPAKAAIARNHFAEAGLEQWIELREGDLRETLKSLTGEIDFVLMDVWTEMVRPAIELISPRLRKGAVVVCDNTEAFRDAYADYFSFVEDPANGLVSRTLPFAGGLEFAVKVDTV